MRQQILAKSLVRVAVHHATNAAWQDLVTPFHGNPEALAKVTEKREEFDRAIEYENEQHRDELMPLYRKMVAHFSENLGYAEPETRAYYPALVSFVEIWERWMKKALPTEALAHLDHGEDTLKPFYAHLEDQVTRLQDQLVERFPLLHPIRRWLRGRLTGQAEQAPDDGTRRLAPSRSLKPMG